MVAKSTGSGQQAHANVVNPDNISVPFACWFFREGAGSTVSAVSNLTIPDLTISGTGDVWQQPNAITPESLAANADNYILETANVDPVLANLMRLDDVADAGGSFIVSVDLAQTAHSIGQEHILSNGWNSNNSEGFWGILNTSIAVGLVIKERDNADAAVIMNQIGLSDFGANQFDGNYHTFTFFLDFARDMTWSMYDHMDVAINERQISKYLDASLMPRQASTTGRGFGMLARHGPNLILGSSQNRTISMRRALVIKSLDDISDKMVALSKQLHAYPMQLPPILTEL